MTTTQVEAIFVFVSASNRDIGQLWIPAKNCGKKCEGLSKFKLGQWLIYDYEKQQIIKTIPAGQEPYETEVYDVGNPEGDVFVQVKTPIIYFSDQAYNEIKAYSPKFGAIGSFFKQKNIVMDQLNYAWISYMSLYRDMDFRKLMKAFEADWVVCSTEDGGLNEEQIHQEIAKGQCKFANGIVVKCEEQFEVVDNEDEGGSPEQNNEGGCSTQSTTNLLPNKYKLKIWTVLQIWTPNLNGGGTPGIAIHRIECEMDKYQQKNLLKIGTLCKMMLAENWSNIMVAVSPIPIELDGINNIVSHGSKIKLEIHRSQFEIDAEIICVPSIIGPINSAHYRQEIPIQKQNLNIFVEFANNQWNLVGFELAQNVKAERPILMGGFGGGQNATRGQFSKFHPTKPVHSINNNSNVGETFPDQTIEKPSKEMEQPKTTLIGGFGRGRGGSTATFSKFRAPKPLLSKSSNSNAGETFPDQTIEETPKIQHPQIGLTGGFGQNARGGRSGASTFRGSSKNLPSTSQRRLSNSTTDSEAIPRAIDTTPPKKLPPFPFSPDRPSPTSSFGHFDFGKFSRPSKENISGVVVSESNSFTPAYPEKECRLSKERALNVKHGSWIRFDSREYSTDHVGVGKYRIEERPAFPTLSVRKTVQIKLKAFVPQRWMPNTSSFVPVVNTEFVEKVVDSRKLLDETFAGQTVAVVIERGKMKEWPGYTWFITKLDEE